MSSPASQSRPWRFVLIGFWRTIPILFALAAGYAIGAPRVGALVGLAFLVSSFGFSRWAKANQSRLDDDRLMMRALTFYFAALAALLVLVALGWLIAERARAAPGWASVRECPPNFECRFVSVGGESR